MKFWVYILRSCDGSRYYIGYTSNVAQRVTEHNSSRAHWTRRHQPWQLVYTEGYATRGEAMKRERELKALKGIGRHLESLKQGTMQGKMRE